MVAPDSPADSATGCFVPEGLDGGKLVKSLRDDLGVNGKTKLFASHIWVMWIPLMSSSLFQL